MDLKIVYFITTSGKKWGKGLTLAAAMEAVGLQQLKKVKKGAVEAVVYFALFKAETTEAELENLKNCITADQIWGNPQFYQNSSDPAYKEDQEMIKKLFLGWASDGSFTLKNPS